MSKDPKSRSVPSETSPDSPTSANPTAPEPPSQTTSLSSPTPEDAPAESPSGAAPDSGRLTLEQELKGEDFALRGWHRMIELVDYLAFHVDGRSTGLYAAENPETYARMLGLASTLKAAVQWFRLDKDQSRPRFVLEAQKYLADGPQGEAIDAPRAFPPNATAVFIPSGPIARRKGEHGAAGRQHDVAELKKDLVGVLEKVEQSDLADHQLAWREAGQPLPKAGWVLAGRLTDLLLARIAHGWCSEMLRGQGFVWRSLDTQFAAVGSAIADVLDDADLYRDETTSLTEWGGRLVALSERVIRAGLAALGVAVEKDFFRDRRG